MSVFKNNLRSVFTSPAKMGIIFVLPLAFIVLYLFGENDAMPTKAAIIDYDNTEFTEVLNNKINENTELIECEENEILDKLLNCKLDYAIVINEGFTQALFAGQQPLIDEYYFIGEEKLTPLKQSIDTFLSNAVHLNTISDNNDEFYRNLKTLDNHTLIFSSSVLTINSGLIIVDLIGMLVQFIFYSSIMIVSGLIVDKENNITTRILSSPMPVIKYLTEHFLSYVVIMLITVTINLIICKYGFKYNFSEHFIEILALTMLFSITIVALSIMILSICRKSKLFYWVMICLTTPIVIISGCYFESSSFPNIINNIAKFLPVAYFMDVMGEIVYNNNKESIPFTIIIFIAFILLFLSISRIGLKKMLNNK